MKQTQAQMELLRRYEELKAGDLLNTIRAIDDLAGMSPAEVAQSIAMKAQVEGFPFVAHQLMTLAATAEDERAGGRAKLWLSATTDEETIQKSANVDLEDLP